MKSGDDRLQAIVLITRHFYIPILLNVRSNFNETLNEQSTSARREDANDADRELLSYYDYGWIRARGASEMLIPRADNNDVREQTFNLNLKRDELFQAKAEYRSRAKKEKEQGGASFRAPASLLFRAI